MTVFGNLGQEWPGEAQHPPVARRPAQDQAQYITAAFVRRQHAVTDQEGDGPAVVGNDAVGDGPRGSPGRPPHPCQRRMP